MAQLRCLWASDSQSTVKDGSFNSILQEIRTAYKTGNCPNSAEIHADFGQFSQFYFRWLRPQPSQISSTASALFRL